MNALAAGDTETVVALVAVVRFQMGREQKNKQQDRRIYLTYIHPFW